MSHGSGNKSIGRVFKVPKASSENFYMLRIERYGESVALTIIDDNLAWNEKVTPDMIKDVCCNRSVNVEDMSEDLVNILSSQNNDYHFSFDSNKFIIKKIDKKTGIKVMLYQFQLEEISPIPTLLSLLNDAVEETFEKKTENNTLITQLHCLEKENKDLISNISKLAEEKDTLEKTLYFNFIRILNTKKEKIAQLQDAVSADSKNVPKPTREENDAYDSDATIDDASFASPSMYNELGFDDENINEQSTKFESIPTSSKEDSFSSDPISHGISSKRILPKRNPRKKMKLQDTHSSDLKPASESPQGTSVFANSSNSSASTGVELDMDDIFI